MTPEKQQFYENLAPAAMEQQIKYGIPASVTLAQAWIEHGSYSKTTNNYFGIHDDDGYWRKNGGKTVLLNDHGRMAHFRVYQTPEQGIEDHSRFFFRKNSRYSGAHGIASTDERFAEKWATVICRAGYAERPKNDPDRYANTIMSEIKGYDLTRFDRMANADAAKRGLAVGYMRPEGSKGITPAVGSYQPTQDYSLASSGYCFPIQKGNMVMSDGFGKDPTSYRNHTHNGIDLSARRGDAIVSTETGRVVKVKNNMTEHDSQAVRQAKGNSGGNYVIVEYQRANGESYRVSYCHLTENGVAVREGQTVHAGTVLGYAGSTGNSTGPHLHMTVRKGKDGIYGDAINPLTYLAEVAARGNLQETVIKKGTHNDLLASLKPQADLTPTPSDEVLLAQNGQQQVNQSQQVQQNMAYAQQALTADALAQQFGQGQDPLQMLSYMMQQQNIQGNPEGFLSELVSSLFKGAMMLAFSLGNDNIAPDMSDGQQPQDATLTPEQKRQEAVLRRRETPDADKARQMASMTFDAESPEQQQSNGVRLA